MRSTRQLTRHFAECDGERCAAGRRRRSMQASAGSFATACARGRRAVEYWLREEAVSADDAMKADAFRGVPARARARDTCGQTQADQEKSAEGWPTRVVSAPEARAQLASDYTHIAGKASAEMAFAFTTSIVDHCETFITFRQRRARPRRPPGRPCARSVFADARAIAFYVGSDTVTIVAIFLMAGITLTRALRGDVDKEGSVS